MNRSQRRIQARQNHKGQTFKDVFKTLVPGVEAFDHDKAAFCWNHRPNLENKDKPTARDKRILDAIRLKPGKRTDPKTGEVIFYRTCPKCFMVVTTDPKLRPTAGMEKGLEGYSDKSNANL